MADQAVTVAVVSSLGALAVATVGGFFTFLASRKPLAEPTVEEAVSGSGGKDIRVLTLAELLVEVSSERDAWQNRALRCEAARPNDPQEGARP